MSRHERLNVLQRMLDYASEAISLVQRKMRGDLDNGRLLNLSLERLLEITGEAANRLS
jgi:hypothetical protein